RLVADARRERRRQARQRRRESGVEALRVVFWNARHIVPKQFLAASYLRSIGATLAGVVETRCWSENLDQPDYRWAVGWEQKPTGLPAESDALSSVSRTA